MNDCTDDPDAEACSEGNRQAHSPAETYPCGQVEQNAREYPEKGALRVIRHDLHISGLFGGEPEEHEQAREGHGGDETGEARQPLSDLGADNDNGHGDGQLCGELHPLPSFPA